MQFRAIPRAASASFAILSKLYPIPSRNPSAEQTTRKKGTSALIAYNSGTTEARNSRSKHIVTGIPVIHLVDRATTL